MGKFAHLVAAALMASAFASVAIAAGPFGSIKVENWTGGAFTDNKKRTFSHCSAASEYQNGSSVTIAKDVRGRFVLSLSDSAWHLMAGEKFPISVTFDDNEHLRLPGIATSGTIIAATVLSQVCHVPHQPDESQPTAAAGTAGSSGLAAFFGGNAPTPQNQSKAQFCKRSGFVDHFRKSHLMVVQTNEQTFQVDLSSGDQLLAAISNCVARVKSGGIANAGDFSGAGQKISAVTGAAEPAASTTPLASGSQPTSPAADAPEKQAATDTAEAAQVSTLESTSSTTAPPENPIATTITEPTRSSRPATMAMAPALPAAAAGTPTDLAGAGLVVDHHGYIVTTNNVVGKCASEIHGNLIGDDDMVLQIVAVDVTNDLALLRAPRRFSEVGSIRETSILAGDPIIAVGSSQQPTPDLNADKGFVSSLSGLSNDTRFMQISVPTHLANDGSPVLDNKGGVTGLIAKKNSANLSVATLTSIPESTNFAIKSGAIRNFLDTSAVSYQIANPQTELTTAQIASNAKTYTVLISCKAK